MVSSTSTNAFSKCFGNETTICSICFGWHNSAFRCGPADPECAGTCAGTPLCRLTNLLLEATSHLFCQTAREVSEKRLGYRAEVSSHLAFMFPLHFQVISKREKRQIKLLWVALTGWCMVVYNFPLTLQPGGGSSAQGSSGFSSEILKLGDELCQPPWLLLFLENSGKGGKFNLGSVEASSPIFLSSFSLYEMFISNKM